MSPRPLAAVPLALALAAAAARAQGPSGPLPPSLPAAAQAAPPPETPAPRWRAQLDLGAVSTSGNSSVRTLNVGEQVAFAPGSWRLTESFALVYGHSDTTETANNLNVRLRADYAVGARFRLFALGNYTRDRFAGIARRFEEAAGLAYVILAGPTHVLDVEAGAGRNQQTPVAGPTTQYWAGRLATHYKLSFTSHAYFEQKVEALSDLENPKNLLLNSESALVAPVSASLALKLGYVVRFANEPPAPGVKKTDTVLSAGLQLQL